MAGKQKVAVVIVNFNTKDLTLSAVKGLQGVDVFVVDNGSTETGLKEALQTLPRVTYWPLPKNIGFGRGNNYALKKISKDYEYILLLNSDAEMTSKALNDLVTKAEASNVDIASCRLIYPNGRFQPNAGSSPSWWHIFTWISGLDDIGNLLGLHFNSYQESKPWYYQRDCEVGWVSGSVMLVKTTLLEKIGFFDDNIFMYGEDVDLCFRARGAGFKIMWFKTPMALHICGASSRDAKYKQWLGEFLGIEYVYRKHYGLIGLLYIKFLLYIFVPVRVILFFVFGRPKYAQYYAKILAQI